MYVDKFKQECHMRKSHLDRIMSIVAYCI